MITRVYMVDDEFTNYDTFLRVKAAIEEKGGWYDKKKDAFMCRNREVAKAVEKAMKRELLTK